MKYTLEDGVSDAGSAIIILAAAVGLANIFTLGGLLDIRQAILVVIAVAVGGALKHGADGIAAAIRRL